MQVFQTSEQAHQYVWNLRRRGATVGLVPTMGALHEGHLSLVRASAAQCDHTIATIFVNPTQFAQDEDLDRYPRTLESDSDGLRRSGADALFVPNSDQIYPPGFSTAIQPPRIAQGLESEFRPEHFSGVATIVLKLFNILPASHAFFGQKDYQQLRVIATMARDLNVDINVVACPIVRDSDGLALSSRNRYLNDRQRKRALRLSSALASAQGLFIAGERKASAIESCMRSELAGVDSIDYAKVVDSITLEPIDPISKDAVALVAAHVGSTRLIDNRLLIIPSRENDD